MALVVVNLALRLRDDSPADVVARDDDAVTVVDLLASPEGVTRTVRGFVFEDAIGLRLCHGRQRVPIACVGPFVRLRGFDPASVEVEQIEVDGTTIVYSVEAVTLVGAVDLTTFVVEDIAR